MITSDDFIGSTTIDLEDRWFEPAWQQLGLDAETADRFRPKPVERRDLWTPSSRASQGQLRLWVDIMTAEQATRYSMVNIHPPPPRPYEVRAIIWKARKMKSGDMVTDMNDLYVKAWLEGEKAQHTDTHFRARKGLGSWNWRMKWEVNLPRKFFYFHIQAWDRDLTKVRCVLPTSTRECVPPRCLATSLPRPMSHLPAPSLLPLQYPDCLGEAAFDLGPMVRRSLRAPTRGLQVFTSDAEQLAQKAKRMELQKRKNELRQKTAALEEDKKRKARIAKAEAAMIKSGLATKGTAHALAEAQIEKEDALAGKAAGKVALAQLADAQKKEADFLGVPAPTGGAAAGLSTSVATAGAGGAVVRRRGGGGASGGAMLPPSTPAAAAGGAGKGVAAEEDGGGTGGEVTTLWGSMAAGASGLVSGAGSAIGGLFGDGTADGIELPGKGGGAAKGSGLSMKERALASATGMPVGALGSLRDAADAGDAKATVAALKKAAGIETDVHPEHAQWLKLLQHTMGAGGTKEEVTGEILVTVELLPAAVATKYPAGFGRSAPNMHPTLPAPAGRLRCTLNPCTCMYQLCGPKLCTIFMCLLGCLAVGACFVFIGPMISTAATLLSALPPEASGPIAVLIGVAVCSGPVFCTVRFLCCAPRVDMDEADLSGSASDEAQPLMDGVGEGDDGGLADEEAELDAEARNLEAAARANGGVGAAVGAGVGVGMGGGGAAAAAASTAAGTGLLAGGGGATAPRLPGAAAAVTAGKLAAKTA
ncbi:MAG: hypothetical protein M9929_15960 [Burkholderiaceae bacterium]|nr:hypothetical protein [Burkholderiaceae bacterium]